MSEFLVQATHSSQRPVGHTTTPPAERANADDVCELLKDFGASIDRLWLSSGEYDLVLIAEVHDDIHYSHFESNVRASMANLGFDRISITALRKLPGGNGDRTVDDILVRHGSSESPQPQPVTEKSRPVLVPEPEPELIPGNPNIYGIHYPNVDGWYIGKNETGAADYMGSPSDNALHLIADEHGKRGLPVVMRKYILWAPPSANRAECRDQEWVWIARFRAEHDGPVFNVFPIQDRKDHLRWHHDFVTHVDRTTNCRWGVYLKLQQHRDSTGNCSQCHQPWTRDERDVFWCKIVYTNGDDEMLYGPGPHSRQTYQSFRKHKLRMLRKEAHQAPPPGKASTSDD